MNRSPDTPGLLNGPLPSLGDPEGDRLPANLPPVVDAHVHVFPDEFFASIWQWFDQFGWPVRYQLPAGSVADFLLQRGISHVVAHHYAHRPGVARGLNRHMAGLCRRCPEITGMATVFPGEEGAAEILREGFSMGLKGVKLHAHVQCFRMDSKAMQTVYEVCVREDRPLMMHVGREPKSPAYPCDPHELCSADRLEEVIRAHPALQVCVPHLGADEFIEYKDLVERYDNLYLDTTMMLAGYLSADPPPLSQWRADRIMFGTDFPNIPYAWDREIKHLLAGEQLPDRVLRDILGRNAANFYRIDWDAGG